MRASEHGVVFCCFNNLYKITPAVFDRWMRILTAVPGSVLWLREDSTTAAANLKKQAELRGVDAARLIFAKRVASLADHLARHRAADLFLDTLPFNAHTTASDALWAGLPVLTQIGDTLAGRVARKPATAVGLPELIARDANEYEDRAIDIARHPETLKALRGEARAEPSEQALFDTERFTRQIEAAHRNARAVPGRPRPRHDRRSRLGADDCAGRFARSVYSYRQDAERSISIGIVIRPDKNNQRGPAMARRLIDISVPLQTDVPADPPGNHPTIQYIDHQQGLPRMLQFFDGLKAAICRTGGGWAVEQVSLLDPQRHASRRALAFPSDHEPGRAGRGPSTRCRWNGASSPA